MLELESSEKNQEKQTVSKKSAKRVLEELDKEIDALHEEKTNLSEIEKKLENDIEEEIKRRKQERNLLKTEVENMQKKCEELAGFVNTFLQEKPVET
jgi:DNA repair exonuclease SbcCD ATPase subunit